MDFSPATKTQDQVKGSFFLDVVIRQRAAIFQLFTRKDQTLLIRGDAFFVLDLGFDVLDGVGRFDIEGDGFTGEGFDEDLHDVLQ